MLKVRTLSTGKSEPLLKQQTTTNMLYSSKSCEQLTVMSQLNYFISWGLPFQRILFPKLFSSYLRQYFDKKSTGIRTEKMKYKAGDQKNTTTHNRVKDRSKKGWWISCWMKETRKHTITNEWVLLPTQDKLLRLTTEYQYKKARFWNRNNHKIKF